MLPLYMQFDKILKSFFQHNTATFKKSFPIKKLSADAKHIETDADFLYVLQQPNKRG